jgi:HAD superfamily hydrolase (TIGR01484 family)
MVAIDIDGTLLDANGFISPLNREILVRVHDAGMPIVLATGRHHREIDEITTQLPFPVYVISSNGAVTRSPSSVVLHCHVLADGLVHDLVMSLLPHVAYASINFDSTTLQPAIVAQCAISARDLLSRNGDIDAMIYRDYVECKRDLPYSSAVQVTLHDRTNSGRLKHQGFRLKPFSSQLAISMLHFPESESYLWEVNGTATTKGSALRTLCDELGIPLSQAVAIGDNWNDLSMLEVVGRPFLMANAPKELRSRFGFQITRSNRADGVRHALLSVWPHLS